MENPKGKIARLSVGIEYPLQRFGIVAIEKGFITVDQLWEALIRQEGQKSVTTERVPIGMILKDMGHLASSQIDEVLEALKPRPQSRKRPAKLSKTRKSAAKGRADE